MPAGGDWALEPAPEVMLTRGHITMVFVYHSECAGYATPGHPERPARVLDSAALLHRVVQGAEWHLPDAADDAALLRAHAPDHLARLDQVEPFDGDTPAYEDLARFARLAAGAALRAMDLARKGYPAMSLMRPPGHHATRSRAMGFCYLNNIAIAALQARAEGVGRIAIWDFDAHHGNGTQDIVAGQEGIRFASVHQSPGYPGTGASNVANCLNYPVPPATPAVDHMRVLRQSWEALRDFDPELVLVSAGFDAYRGDPITTMSLEREDFLTLGSWLHEADLATAAILEGGYSKDLPQLIEAFVEGWLHG